MENDITPIEVTVLMSVYKESIDYLKASIESILNQTYRNFEFLIVNDGNNQALVELIHQYHDKRIRLIQNETNIGLERSLNKGLAEAKGKYIVRMDADDISYLNRIEKQVAFIKKNPQYALISGNAEIFDENGTYGKTKGFGEKGKNDLIKGTPFIHPTMLIQKDVLKKIGGYPLYKRCEDYAMVMNLYACGYCGYVMKDILLKYRMDKNGYQKKKYRNRLTEAKVRMHYYKKMKVKWYQYIYVLKPVIIGLIPKRILKRIHQRKFR